jgi:hypothetical protein
VNTHRVIVLASGYLKGLVGQEVGVLAVMKPVSPEAAAN